MKEDNEDQIAELLRLAGPRPRISDERTARVREAVHAEWKRSASKRRSGVTWLAVAAAAVIAMILFVPRANKTPTPLPAAVVATVQAVHGNTMPVLGTTINESTWVETLTGSTLSLDWNGATLRFGEGTRVQLNARTATLERGVVYFDSNVGAAALSGTATAEGSGRHIKTRFGEIRDIGTQFEVRLDEDSLRIRVREGRVDLRRGNQTHVADAAMELVADGSSVRKNAIAVSGVEWKWIEDAAPPLRLEGLTLRDALTRVAREKGLRVELQGVDGNVRLHGSVEFTPDEALAAATAATSAAYQIKNDTLVVRRRR
ncbi:MAG TPA: FecR domain-containing protein [Thermoanaerobaculia bacterium]|nr:FecR domain-containing protein [Thermoanaerobaculia bacterium]